MHYYGYTIFQSTNFFVIYTGLSAAMTSVAPQAGIQFASYHFLSSMWDKLGATEVSRLVDLYTSKH